MPLQCFWFARELTCECCVFGLRSIFLSSTTASFMRTTHPQSLLNHVLIFTLPILCLKRKHKCPTFYFLIGEEKYLTYKGSSGTNLKYATVKVNDDLGWFKITCKAGNVIQVSNSQGKMDESMQVVQICGVRGKRIKLGSIIVNVGQVPYTLKPAPAYTSSPFPRVCAL